MPCSFCNLNVSTSAATCTDVAHPADVPVVSCEGCRRAGARWCAECKRAYRRAPPREQRELARRNRDQ